MYVWGFQDPMGKMWERGTIYQTKGEEKVHIY